MGFVLDFPNYCTLFELNINTIKVVLTYAHLKTNHIFKDLQHSYSFHTNNLTRLIVSSRYSTQSPT